MPNTNPEKEDTLDSKPIEGDKCSQESGDTLTSERVDDIGECLNEDGTGCRVTEEVSGSSKDDNQEESMDMSDQPRTELTEVSESSGGDGDCRNGEVICSSKDSETVTSFDPDIEQERETASVNLEHVPEENNKSDPIEPTNKLLEDITECNDVIFIDEAQMNVEGKSEEQLCTIKINSSFAQLMDYCSSDEERKTENTRKGKRKHDERTFQEIQLNSPFDSDSEEESSSCSSIFISDSSAEEDEGKDENKVKIERNVQTRKSNAAKTITKTKGEITIQELPPIERLQISVPEEECLPLGTIYSIVDAVVVIESNAATPALNLDSVIFTKKGKSLGKIFDVFGPVSRPFYVLVFTSKEELEKEGFKVGDTVYCAPQTEHTSYVFTAQLLRQKGSDASWKYNNEPPPEYLDYSDDEEESRAKQSLRQEKMNCKKIQEDPEAPVKKKFSSLVSPHYDRPVLTAHRNFRGPGNNGQGTNWYQRGRTTNPHSNNQFPNRNGRFNKSKLFSCPPIPTPSPSFMPEGHPPYGGHFIPQPGGSQGPGGPSPGQNAGGPPLRQHARGPPPGQHAGGPLSGQHTRGPPLGQHAGGPHPGQPSSAPVGWDFSCPPPCLSVPQFSAPSQGTDIYPVKTENQRSYFSPPPPPVRQEGYYPQFPSPHRFGQPARFTQPPPFHPPRLYQFNRQPILHQKGTHHY